MNQTTLTEFESRLQLGSALEVMWKNALPSINDGKVDSREKAYILFSKVLKISELTREQEGLQEGLTDLWLKLLDKASFSLCINDQEPIPYNFNTLLKLLKSGKNTFEVEIVEADPNTVDLAIMAEAIHSIALSSLGNSPGANLFQTILRAPNTFCLLAKTRKNYIACTYGSYLTTAQVKFFHLNFLGRKIEYPSIHLVEKLQDEAKRIQNKFPDVHYLTLCVSATNHHMMPIYKQFGFEELEYIEAGFKNEPTYFYAKKINQESKATPPTYLEYKAALEASRKT